MICNVRCEVQQCPDSLNDNEELLFRILVFIIVFFQDLKKAGVLIYANKQDMKGSMTAAEITQHLNLTSIKDHCWHIQACCALTGEG